MSPSIEKQTQQSDSPVPSPRMSSVPLHWASVYVAREHWREQIAPYVFSVDDSMTAWTCPCADCCLVRKHLKEAKQ